MVIGEKGSFSGIPENMFASQVIFCSPPPKVSEGRSLNFCLISLKWGRGNSTVGSVSVCHTVSSGSRPARSACFRNVEFYHCVILDSLITFVTITSPYSPACLHV